MSRSRFGFVRSQLLRGVMCLFVISYSGAFQAHSSNAEWVSHFSGLGFPASLILTNCAYDTLADAVYAVGQTEAPSEIAQRYVLRRNADGRLDWAKKLTPLWIDRVTSSGPIISPSGNVIIATVAEVPSRLRICVDAFAPNGDSLWEYRFYEADLESGAGLTLASDSGGVYAAWKMTTRSDQESMHILKLDNQGRKIWYRTDHPDVVPGKLVPDLEDGVILAAQWLNALTLYRFDPHGQTTWMRSDTIDDGNVWPMAVRRDFGTGTLTVASLSRSQYSGVVHPYLLKYSSSGDLLRKLTFDTVSTDIFFSFHLAGFNGSGTCFFAGITQESQKLLVVSSEGKELRRFEPDSAIGQINVFGLSKSGQMIVGGSSYWKYPYVPAGFLCALDDSGHTMWKQRDTTCISFLDITVGKENEVYAVAPDSGTMERYSQYGVHEWTQHYVADSVSRHFPKGIVVDSKGNTIVTGYDQLLKGNELITASFSPSGGLLWSSKLPSLSGLALYPVTVDSNDNVFVAGVNNSNTMFLVKFNPEGEILWRDTISLNGDGINPFKTCITPNGRIVMFGYGSGLPYARIATFDGNGTLLGTTNLAAVSADTSLFYENIETDSVGNYYVGGRLGANGASRPFVGSLTQEGTLRWLTTIQVPDASDVSPARVSVNRRGQSVACGLSASGDVVGNWIASYDGGGQLLWQNSWQKSGRFYTDWGHAGIDPNGMAYFATAESSSTSVTGFSATGSKVWKKEIPWDGPEFWTVSLHAALSVEQLRVDPTGAVILTSRSGALHLERINSVGSLTWEARDSTLFPMGNMEIGHNNRLYLMSTGNYVTGQEMTVSKYRMDTLSLGVIGENRSPGSFALDMPYPNPFNPQTSVSYSLPVDARVRLTIYNVLGQQVLTLSDKEEQAGTHNVVWNAANNSSGVYFIRMEATDSSDRSAHFITTRKVLLLR